MYLYINPILFKYGFPNHPLNVERYQEFLNRFERIRDEYIDCIVEVNEFRCSESYLKLFHTKGYIEYVKRLSELGSGFLDYGDTPAYKGVYDVSLVSVCATRDAVLKTIDGGVAVNLAGGWHHAFRDRASGFCVFNDIGVAIESIRDVALNILYIDIDAHHGDGIYYSYESDPNILIFDIHESPRFLFPGTGYSYETGKGEAVGTKVNIEVMPGADGNILLNEVRNIDEFITEKEFGYVIIQAGTDGISGDPLTHLDYDIDSFVKAVKYLVSIAFDRGVGVTLLGGGGYQPKVFGEVWIRIITEICGML